ncbi:MAG: hypothetical protein Kow0031_15360 [Anaerolineae bacterium]
MTPVKPRHRLFIATVLFLLPLLACGFGGESEPAAPPAPTTAPLQAVQDAIMAANQQNYDAANQLLDISALAEAAEAESVNEHWDWFTSNQRVASVDAREEETRDDARLLFITVQNDNYPTHQFGFWIRWQGDRWVAFEEE